MDRGIYTQLILLVIRALSTTHKTKISETFIIYIAWSKSYKCFYPNSIELKAMPLRFL